MTGGSTGGLRANRASIVLAAGARESLFDARLEVAFRLSTNRGQLRNPHGSRDLHPITLMSLYLNHVMLQLERMEGPPSPTLAYRYPTKPP